MSMQAPQGIEDLATVHRTRIERQIKYTRGCVSPGGVVSTHVVEPPLAGHQDGLSFGDTMYRWVNGEPQLQKHHRDAGHIDYEELARADDQLDVYQNWKRAIAVRLRGGTIAGDVGQLYTKSVHERRARAADGNTSGQVFVIGHGEVSGADAKKERVAALLSSAGLGNPLDEPEPKAEKGKK